MFFSDNLISVSQSFEYRRRGFLCAVPVQSSLWVENLNMNKLVAQSSIDIKEEYRKFIREYQEYILPRQKYDEYKLAIIVHETDDKRYNNIYNQLNSIILPVPYSLTVSRIGDVINLASKYNEVMLKNNARYKIYLSDTEFVNIIKLIENIMKIFLEHSNIGLVGGLGAILSVSGHATKSKKIFGRYLLNKKEKLYEYIYNKPLFYQEVNCLDPSFMATRLDVFWDETVGQRFLGTSACCRMMEHGFKSVVIEQHDVLLRFHHESIFSDKLIDEKYETSLDIFLRKYGKRIFPLVSILIPTYNSPSFFQQALDSALNQDYKNIEIIVGDDSTNEHTKHLMRSYLDKYEFIRYFFHGGPRGNNGRENMAFLINHCSGQYVNCLQHDDLIYPHKISRMMEYFLVYDEIHMATSVRDFIDADGNIINVCCPWIPDKDQIINCFEIGLKILDNINNFIGETSTVLIKKSLLRYNQGYMIGFYCGIRDMAYFDISTWLELGIKGGQCVFINERLSAFRQHDQQNTVKLDMQFKFVLDFFSFIVLSWLNNTYIKTEKHYKEMCDKWFTCFTNSINTKIEQASDKILKEIIGESFFKSFVIIRDYIKVQQYDEALNEIIDYILSHTENKNAIYAVCEHDEHGKWKKRV